MDLAGWLIVVSLFFLVLFIGGSIVDRWEARERAARSKDGPRWR